MLQHTFLCLICPDSRGSLCVLLYHQQEESLACLRFSSFLRRAEAHHRSGHHKKGYTAGLWHVPVPTHEPPASLCFPGGLPGDNVSPVQISRALCQAALPLSTHPQIQPETQIFLSQEVTGEDTGWLDTDLSAESGRPWHDNWGMWFLPGLVSLSLHQWNHSSYWRVFSFFYCHERTDKWATCANTNPVICTKPNHGGLFF